MQFTAALGRALVFVLWGGAGAIGGFLAIELVGWVLDPAALIVLWHFHRKTSARDQFLVAYALGYLAITAHYLIPHLYAAWPSPATRIYFGVLLLAGVVLLVASASHLTAVRLRRPSAPGAV